MAAIHENIPQELRDRRQWVHWRLESRDGGKPTKIPYRADGMGKASSTDPATWSTFDEAIESGKRLKPSGIGYVFAKDDPYVGVDLDDCRDPASGDIQPWAQKLIDGLDTYAEVSPSKTGVKLWCKATLPTDQTGKRTKYETGAIELYQSGRYFAVTGQALKESPITTRQSELGGLWARLFGSASAATTPNSPSCAGVTDAEACWARLERMPDSVAGENGHDKMLAACCEILRHGITGDEAWELINRFNDEKSDPTWNRAELEHKWKSANEKVLRGREFGVLSTDPEKGRKFKLGLVEYHDFLSMDFPQTYLIDGILAQGEHAVIGGPKKVLKTSTVLDLMIALASGRKFLGHFDVKKPVPVAFISGESGRATLQRAAQRMVAARNARIPKDRWFIGFDLPQIANIDHLAAIEDAVREYGIGFLAVDPAYLAMLQGRSADSASNVFAMGAVLKGFGEIGARTGCTMALVHHTGKLGKQPFRPLDLDDLSQAGFAEWARQWLLLSRRSGFNASTGHHELYLSVGGSAGHSGLWEVDVTEGKFDKEGGRGWAVEVRESVEFDEGPTRIAEDASKVMSAVLAAADGVSPTKVREITKLRKDRADAAIDHLVKADEIVISEGQRGGKKITAKLDWME